MNEALVEFLRARLDEDEAAAMENRAWMAFDVKDEDDWMRLMYDPVIGPFGGQSPTRNVATGMYVAKMSNPARVLREVEAKRAILRRCARFINEMDQHPNGLVSPRAVQARHTLAHLTAIYSDHPGYRQEWGL